MHYFSGTFAADALTLPASGGTKDYPVAASGFITHQAILKDGFGESMAYSTATGKEVCEKVPRFELTYCYLIQYVRLF